MAVEKKPSRMYFAGAYVTFGIAFVGVEVLSFLYGVSPADPDFQGNLSVVIVGLHLLGGVVGGFLVAKRSPGDRLQAGTLTGVVAYIIEEVVHAVLYGWGVVGDAYTMLALIGGSIVGALGYDSQVRRLERARSGGPPPKVEGESPSSSSGEPGGTPPGG
jgi:putative membrane protein (TIGR04086 family)